MRVSELGGLGGVEAPVLRLHEDGKGRSVLRVGQAKVQPEGGHQGGQRRAQQQRQGDGSAEEVQAVLLHPRAACVSATCPLSVPSSVDTKWHWHFCCAQFTVESKVESIKTT